MFFLFFSGGGSIFPIHLPDLVSLFVILSLHLFFSRAYILSKFISLFFCVVCSSFVISLNYYGHSNQRNIKRMHGILLMFDYRILLFPIVQPVSPCQQTITFPSIFYSSGHCFLTSYCPLLNFLILFNVVPCLL